MDPPAYGSGSLCEVLPSAAAAIGVPGMWDVLGIGEEAGSRHDLRGVIVLLIDGLGWLSLQEHLDIAPHLMGGRSIDAAVPTTTPTGLAALGTGLPPGGHGLVGASFRVEDHHGLVHPLSWQDSPSPLIVQPEPTVFERVERRGFRVASISPRPYAVSGLTRAVLRGGTYIGADGFGERIAEVRSLVQGNESFLAYVYWPDLDKAGHIHGVDSDHWRAELAHVDQLVATLRAELPGDVALVVTADHGMVDSVGADRIDLDELMRGSTHLGHNVTGVGGEPRCRHIYVRSGTATEVAADWARELSGIARVVVRDELIDEGYFGAVADHISYRIGDVVALCEGAHALVSPSIDSMVSSLKGQHGSITEQEMKVPLVVWRHDDKDDLYG
jgi:hypothetical protein